MADVKHSIPGQLALPLTYHAAEEWRPVVGFEGLYEVSTLGEVRSVDRVVAHIPGFTQKIKGQLLRQYAGDTGRGRYYSHLRLCKEGKYTQKYVHDVVLTAFVGPRPDGHVCNHRDNDPLHNALNNLEWVTQKQNVKHAMDIGAFNVAGERHPLTCSPA